MWLGLPHRGKQDCSKGISPGATVGARHGMRLVLQATDGAVVQDVDASALGHAVCASGCGCGCGGLWAGTMSIRSRDGGLWNMLLVMGAHASAATRRP
jgi:hypothetical protein